MNVSCPESVGCLPVIVLTSSCLLMYLSLGQDVDLSLGLDRQFSVTIGEVPFMESASNVFDSWLCPVSFRRRSSDNCIASDHLKFIGPRYSCKTLPLRIRGSKGVSLWLPIDWRPGLAIEFPISRSYG